MSDQNYFNRTDRQLFPINWTHSGPIDEVFLEIGLTNNQNLDAVTSPVIPENVGYTSAADNGFFSVSASQELTITRAGVYSVSITTSFDESGTNGGARQHYIELDRSGIKKNFGLTIADSSDRAAATNMGTCLNSSVVISLNIGDKLVHKATSLNNGGLPVQSIIIGDAVSATNYTRFTLVYLNSV